MALRVGLVGSELPLPLGRRRRAFYKLSELNKVVHIRSAAGTPGCTSVVHGRET